MENRFAFKGLSRQSIASTALDSESDDDSNPNSTIRNTRDKYQGLAVNPHPGRISFSQTTRPTRYGSRWPETEPHWRRQSIQKPHQVPPPPSISAEDSKQVTPLPILSITVLCIAMFGEFLSASTAAPFMYFMVESFGVGQGPNGGGEAAVGFWAGIVGSVFFFSQFGTSLLWVSVAEQHGRRAVLLASLLGNGLSLIAFGASSNLPSAICIRLIQGLFNGAVGVARSAVQGITDSTNESAAFTYMGLAWGLGGIVGSVVGGLTESPVKHFPSLFSEDGIFATYPYLFPCILSGSVCLIGGFLSLFLGPDARPRDGGIRLPTEKDLSDVRSSCWELVRRIGTWITPRQKDEEIRLITDTDESFVEEGRSTTPTGTLKFGSTSSRRKSVAARNPSRSSGTAYGYNYGRTPSQRFRTMSFATNASTRYAPDYEDLELNFAQRLLLANEPAVHNISDLWVARETRDDATEFDTRSILDDTESRLAVDDNDEVFSDIEDQNSIVGEAINTFSPHSTPYSARSRTGTFGSTNGVPPRLDFRRRLSAASSARGPAIFANTGLEPSSLGLIKQAQELASSNTADDEESRMEVIPETRPSSVLDHQEPYGGEDLEMVSEKQTNLMAQLPLTVIAQYALVALHGTTCDQVFVSFVVTPVLSGGLGLTAADYAMLIAVMFGFQMLWQFQFYPAVAAPRGPFSHLVMFRLGLSLYIPVYLLFPQLRGLLAENTNFWVMFGMVVLSALRFLANTCAYTAVMVLVNAMSPPHLVPLANGTAQAAVSLARFIGPIVGGSIWAASIADGPNAHAWPFNYAAGFVLVAVICSMGLLHSFRIH